MRYISTRGGAAAVSAAQAILQGIAPDGGLYVPGSIPILTREDWAILPSLDYAGMALLVLRKFLDDFDDALVEQCVHDAYGGAFGADPAPLASRTDGVHMLELWHGPTAAFKDMALQLMPRLFSAALEAEGSGRRALVLVATSGDTGKAALEGFRDLPGTAVAVLYPLDGVSDVQKRQMTTQQGGNVAVAALRGNFDDAQRAVKAIFADRELIGALDTQNIFLSSANSINWGRLLPQIVYYIRAAVLLRASGALQEGEVFDIAVPTGNFGNILAAWYAKQMGAPVERLICASNANDVLTSFIQSGCYDRERPFYKTDSPSMDILVSSNLERLLFELSGRDADSVKGWMAALQEKGQYRVDGTVLAALQKDFAAESCTDAETRAEIARVWQQSGYLLDPHTAVASAAARRWRPDSDRPLLVVATASPFKFAPAVLEALDGSKPADSFAATRELAAHTGQPVPASLCALETLPERHQTILNSGDIKRWLLDSLPEIF